MTASIFLLFLITNRANEALLGRAMEKHGMDSIRKKISSIRHPTQAQTSSLTHILIANENSMFLSLLRIVCVQGGVYYKLHIFSCKESRLQHRQSTGLNWVSPEKADIPTRIQVRTHPPQLQRQGSTENTDGLNTRSYKSILNLQAQINSGLISSLNIVSHY